MYTGASAAGRSIRGWAIELGRGSSTLLVQYVPTGFGLRGANIPWCRWLLERRRRHGDDVRVMFHEPYFEFTWSPIQQNALAVAERLMAKMLLRAASRVYLSTDAWRRYLAPHTSGGGPPSFITLPIPSAIPRCDRPADVVERRKRLLGSSARQLVGHFGTFGSEVAPMLTAALTSLMEQGAGMRAVCVGSGSDAFVRSLDDASPTLRGRAIATGRVSARDAARSSVRVTCSCNLTRTASRHRRTSIMAGLVNARAIVTTTGHLTEPVWADTGAVALVPARDKGSFVALAQALLSDEKKRAALAARGEQVYLIALRSRTRSAPFEARSKARPYERRATDDRHHHAQPARGPASLPALARRRRASVSRSHRVRRRLINAGTSSAWLRGMCRCLSA